MRLGIDFGTTHTVAAIVDRGNYPVVSYDWGDVIPSLVAVRNADGALRLGQDALVVTEDAAWTVLRSLKRYLADAGPLSEIQAGERSMPLLDLLVAYLEHLREDLVRRSYAGFSRGDEQVRRRIVEECRRQNAGVGPNSRRLVVDLELLGRAPIVLPMDEVYEACAPLVARTIEAMDEVMRDPRRETEDVGWN